MRKNSVLLNNSLALFCFMILLSFLNTIETFDHWLFYKINVNWSNGFFDAVMPLLRESSIWIPLYLFLFVFSLMNFGKRATLWILFFAITVSLTDQISSGFFKEYFGRLRPCRDTDVAHSMFLRVVYCPKSGSFTSSHAANHFAMAAFIFFTCKDYFLSYRWLFFVWALIIGYAQVYVGVHYPLDVVGGAFTGLFIGAAIGILLNKQWPLPPVKFSPPQTINPT